MSHEKEKAYFEQMYAKQLAYFNDQYEKLSVEDAKKEFPKALALLSARLQVVEELLVFEKRKVQTFATEEEVKNWPHELTITSEELGDTPNLYKLETYQNRAYRWSGQEKYIDIALRINRSKPRELLINLVALIKPEYVQNLTLTIDGAVVEHNARESDSMIQLHAMLKSEKFQRSASMLRIALPETYSPAELGDGTDTRKMGIAIHSIAVQPVSNRLKRFIS